MSDCALCGSAREGDVCPRCDAAVDVDKVLGLLDSGAMRPEPLREIGRYRISRRLGEGGAGVVYEAVDSSLGRPVALKLLKTKGLDRALLERFLREARVLARLEHPNIVRIFELGRDAGSDFLVMELVEGKPYPATSELRESIRRLALIARALHHAHNRGVVHRDLKPSNVLVEAGGRPVLMDFGIARAADAASSLTATGMVMGTPGYMAPEQFEGDPSRIDHRVDVWSLGVMLYETLSGRRAYTGATVVQVADAVRHSLPPRPGEVRSGVPRELEAVWARAMAPRPEDRYARAKDVAEDLERWLAGRVPGAPPLPASPARKLRLAAGAVALATLLGAAALLRRDPAPPPSPAADPGPGPLDRARALLAGAPSAEIAAKAESELRLAVSSSPRPLEARRALAALHASRFRVDAAHEEFDAALALEADPATLAAKGDLLLTSLLVYRIDRLQFRDLVGALHRRIAETLGPTFDRWADRFPAARVYARAARGDFEAARRAVEGNGPDAALLRLVLDYLDDGRRPGTLLVLARLDDSGAGERALWLPLIRGQEQKTVVPSAVRAPLHAGLLRLEAWGLDTRGDDAGAAARLSDALISAPDYLPARLARAKVLESLKDPVQAASELDIARKQAKSAGLGEIR